jgi:hypothetical protein
MPLYNLEEWNRVVTENHWTVVAGGVTSSAQVFDPEGMYVGFAMSWPDNQVLLHARSDSQYFRMFTADQWNAFVEKEHLRTPGPECAQRVSPSRTCKVFEPYGNYVGAIQRSTDYLILQGTTAPRDHFYTVEQWSALLAETRWFAPHPPPSGPWGTVSLSDDINAKQIGLVVTEYNLVHFRALEPLPERVWLGRHSWTVDLKKVMKEQDDYVHEPYIHNRPLSPVPWFVASEQ